MSYILITVIITVINLKLMKLLIHFFIIRKGDSCGSIKIQPTTWSDQALSCIHKGTSNSRYRIYACKEGISQYQSWHCISNLNLLTDIGEAIKISTPDGGDRFDGTVQPHNHFLCTKCGRFLDLELDMKSIEEMNRLANDCFDGMITSSSTLFYGECSDCIRKS